MTKLQALATVGLLTWVTYAYGHLATSVLIAVVS